MDVKKILEWGAIAVIAWLVLTWLLGTVESVAASFGQTAQLDPYQAPLLYPGYLVYGAPWGGSPVRWGGGRSRGGGYTGRPQGAGGY